MNNPNFSSGPCSKRPGWDLDTLRDAAIGRSHRSSLGREKLALAINESKRLLEIPEGYLLGILPASDTGTFELAMWSLLGPKPVTVLVWESFSEGWATDVTKELKLNPTILRADYGKIPNLADVDWSHDVVFVANGTTSGVKIPNWDWISSTREGLSLCDATSAAFAMPIDWSKVDVLTYSWQKCLGGEAAHGILVLSPRAVQRIESYDPSWPMPKIFRLKKGGGLNRTIFDGDTINTPSMLCVEDYLDAL
ncbi:MAG: phosphoserine transaminase, partial [Deltaproteobacteria bacterium]|nr:phosphoserine transaminase [Deltaproteobacteria bacterium]